MSVVKTGMSAVGRLLIVVALLGAFLAGLFGVVIFSLRGEEVSVPEIVGKNFSDSEKELASLGLKIRKRATRYSQEAPNTILEQSPRPGETVKTGIPVFVTISRTFTEGDETPVEVEKEPSEEEATNDNEPVNTALTKKDKPKKDPKKANSNANSNTGGGNQNNNSSGDNKNSSGGNDNSKGTNPTNNSNNKNNNKSTTPANTAKPQPAKSPAGAGDTRSRRVP